MYTPNEHRYEKMVYNRCGKSGLKLPAVSLGIWQNFGYKDSFDNMEEMVHTAFDLGITHFDIANNYGHPYNGSAEEIHTMAQPRRISGKYLTVECGSSVMSL